MINATTNVGEPAKVLVVDPIAPKALKDLHAAYDVQISLQPAAAELPSLLDGIDAIVLRSGITLPREIIEAASRLRVIARAGSGTDNIDLGAARTAGIQVFNIPNVSSSAVAELALGLAFAVARNIAVADRQIRAGVWRKAELTGTEFAGKTMGIVGLGSIGGNLARLAGGIGMNVIASVARPNAIRRRECQAEGIRLVETAELLERADVVVLACPLNKTTRDLIGTAELASMKPTAYLVNVARAGVVNEDALYTALQAGRIAGAGMDVHSVERAASPFAELDNVVLTPHIGAMSHDAQERIGDLLISCLSLALSGQDAPTRIC
jgi:D-3-phosphoglycerate dehydrogenase